MMSFHESLCAHPPVQQTSSAGPVNPAVRLSIRSGDDRRSVVLEAGSFTVGSSSECDIAVADPTLSRAHAQITLSENGVVIRDLGSSNGIKDEQGNPRATTDTEWKPATRLWLGEVALDWQPLASGDSNVALALDHSYHPQSREDATLQALAVDRFTRKHLAPLLHLLADRAELRVFARALGEALVESLPIAAAQIAREDAVLFQVGTITDAAMHQAGESFEIFLEAADGQLSDQLATMGGIAHAFLMACTDEDVAQITERSPQKIPRPVTLDGRMKRIYDHSARAARGKLNILILGESGTGKEVLARFIHAQLPQRQPPFIALNCAALPENLLEAELFGIEKGVATGVTKRVGKFELASGGVLFLDEIGDMPPSIQAKILRVLQEGEVVPLGASEPRPIDVQIVSASNKNVQEMVAAGAFRLDLYHRLGDWELELPPLRERPADIPNLALYFLARAARELERSVRGLSQRALDALLTYSWPGNVRELEREMKRVAAFADADQLITSEDLANRIRNTPRPLGADLKSQVEREERRIIEAALVRLDRNVSAVAKELDIGRSTLYRYFDRLDITPPDADQDGR